MGRPGSARDDASPAGVPVRDDDVTPLSHDDVSPAGVPVWQVCHNGYNLWRDFPDHLAEAVEREYQSWVEGGRRPEIATAYVWTCRWGPDDEGDVKLIDYELSFHDMRQQRVTPSRREQPPPRKMRRLLAPSQ